MLRRLILAFLIACLAFPAAVPVHGAPPATDIMMARDHHHENHGDHPPAATHHECIGCIAPLDIRLYRPLNVPDITARTRQPHDLTSSAPSRPAAPEPPPPRHLA